MSLLHALAVVEASATVGAALDALRGYDDAARAVVRRRVEGFDLYYLLTVAELRGLLAGGDGAATLEDAAPWADLAAVEALQESSGVEVAVGETPRVVLRGSRVVGIAEGETAGSVAAVPPPAPGAGRRERGFRSRAPAARETAGEGFLVPVYYATDRAPEGESEGKQLYGARRGELGFGIAEVSIPLDHRKGKIERPPWWRRREDTERDVVVLTVRKLKRPDFVAGAAGEVGKSAGREVILFVHGYRVSFPEALRRTAQLAHDLMPSRQAGGASFDALPVLFSWPSQGELLDYLTDEVNARWAVDHFEQVLELVLTELGAATVHVVAHSMGNRVLVEALRTFDPAQLAAGSARLREVVLAAPDVDADTFRAFARRFHQRAGSFTLYASSNDRALALSRQLRGGLRRAGESGADLVVVDGVQTIDASGVMREDFLSHSYFAQKTVLSDLFYLLKHDFEPGDRDGLRKLDRDGLPYWEFVSS